jgi:hypothetical protein
MQRRTPGTSNLLMTSAPHGDCGGGPAPGKQGRPETPAAPYVRSQLPPTLMARVLVCIPNCDEHPTDVSTVACENRKA